MMDYTDPDARIIKERVDMLQLWNAWVEADELRRHSFLGSMNWEDRNGKQYLYSRKAKVAKSLGPRSDATEKTFAAFTDGKRSNADRLKSLGSEIDRQASVLRVLGAGRLPVMAARTPAHAAIAWQADRHSRRRHERPLRLRGDGGRHVHISGHRHRRRRPACR